MHNLDTLQTDDAINLHGRMRATKRRPGATNGNTVSEAAIFTSHSVMNLAPQISFYDFLCQLRELLRTRVDFVYQSSHLNAASRSSEKVALPADRLWSYKNCLTHLYLAPSGCDFAVKFAGSTPQPPPRAL